MNICDPVLFPAMEKKWRYFVDELGEEGLNFV